MLSTLVADNGQSSGAYMLRGHAIFGAASDAYREPRYIITRRGERKKGAGRKEKLFPTLTNRRLFGRSSWAWS